MVTKYQAIIDGSPARFHNGKIYHDAPITEFVKVSDLDKRCELYGIADYKVQPVTRHTPEIIKELAM